MDPALREIAERIRAAAADHTTLRIRGGGTKDFYGEAPQGQVLSTTALQGITSYEPSELVVTVRAGTLLSELEATLAAQGQCLPFEPPHFGAGSTVGGMVAAGLSGPARASVGAVRDYVLGATLVNGRGHVLAFGGQVMKNVAGYDVSRVLAGSLGVLGVIAEVSLKVLPVAPAEATLSFDCSQADALSLLNAWGGQPLPLNASRWAGQADGASGTLWLRLRGAVAAVASACAHLGGERVEEAQSRDAWLALRDARFTRGELDPEQALWRVAVPQTAGVLAIGGSPVVEWHGGQRWYAVPASEAAVIRTATKTAGGHATLFRLGRQPLGGVARFDALTPPLQRIHDALQREFDPDAVFDRGRLFNRG